MGSHFATCMWIYTEETLTRGHTLNPEQEEYLKKRMMSIMLCTTWVCAGTFVDHEWESSRTIDQHVEEVMGMELNYKIDVPCVVRGAMESVVVFSTNEIEYHLKDMI